MIAFRRDFISLNGEVVILSDASIGLDFDSFGQICALLGFSQRVLFRLN